jgi:hypothetical protein
LYALVSKEILGQCGQVRGTAFKTAGINSKNKGHYLISCWLFSSLPKCMLGPTIKYIYIYMIIKNAVFWDVTPCGSYKIRRFFAIMKEIVTLNEYVAVFTFLNCVVFDRLCGLVVRVSGC